MKMIRMALMASAIAVIAMPMTGCYTKVVRDDSVEGRLSRATGQPSPKKEEPPKSSWWPW